MLAAAGSHTEPALSWGAGATASNGGARSPLGPWRGGGRGAWMGVPTIGAVRHRKAPRGASASVMFKYAANDNLKGTLYTTIGAPMLLASPTVFLHTELILKR